MKNFILHVTQEVAKALGLVHIYAVTNYGYYANTHMRMEKKLKTSFTVFWEESGGHPCEDKCFYELPMTEARKTMEEIPTRKWPRAWKSSTMPLWRGNCLSAPA